MSADVRRVQAVFLAAVEAADAAEQAAILDRECASDPELRRRVEALLLAHRDPASILDRPALGPGLGGAFPRTAHPDWSDDTTELFNLGFLGPATRPGALGRIGHYEVLELLGRGGFGIVLRAHDEVLQREVAVKVLAPQMAATSPARKRFVREAQSYAAIRHENVVQVHAVEEQPLPYLVMELIPGETLQQRLDRTGPLDVSEILSIGCQIAEGLAAAHATGLIHRDVKPANVLIESGPHQRVKLTDFGLARAADDASLTQSGLVAGTPLYMAPEQARGDALDHRADLFSLGSVLYVMCTGRPPFRAGGTLAVLKRVCEDVPRPIPEIIPETPSWLCDLIARLHAKDPADRLQSAREVADLLQRYQKEFTTHGKVVSLPVHPARPKRSRGVALAAAAVAAVPIGVLAFILIGPPRHGSGGPLKESSEKTAWRPGPLPRPEELARLPSPFDELDRRDLPRDIVARMFGAADKAPPELVAVLDVTPARLPRPGRTSWFAQDREGLWLAVPSETEVVLFDGHTLAPRKVLGGFAGRVYQVAFSPDGRRLAVASWSDEDSATVYDVQTGEPKLKLPLQRSCWSIQFSPDGTRLLTVGEDHTPILWNATSGEEVRRFPAQDQPICADATFTPDGKQIVTHTAGGRVTVWKMETWDEVKTLDGPEQVTEQSPDWLHFPLAVSPDGKWLAAGSESGFKVWSTTTWGERPITRTPATWIAFAPDSRTLLTGRHACGEWRLPAVTRWDVETREQLRSETLGSRGAWAVYHLSADGNSLYAMACDPAEPSVRVYDADSLKERSVPADVGRTCAVDVSPDGATIASAGADGSVRLWDAATRRLLHTVSRAGKTAIQALFSADGGTLYGAWQEDGVIFAVEVATGRWRQLGIYGPKLQRLAVSPDATLLAAAGDGGVRLWALPDGTPRGQMPALPQSPGALAFSPDAKTLAVGGVGSVGLFDLATGRPTMTLACPGAVRGVAFRPDGRSLAASGESPGEPVQIFDVATGTRTLRLEGDENPVLSRTWRADGGLLATAGQADGRVRLWDFAHAAPRQRVLSLFERDGHGIDALALSPEGRHLVTANPDGTIAILRLAKAGAVFRVP
jgi:serine/threonine protein kinase/WD40 repeat protein